MGHGVGLQPSWAGDFIMPGAKGNLVFEQPSRLRSTPSAALVVGLARGQKTVDLGGADLEQFLAPLFRETSMLALIGRQPQRQQRNQALPAGLLGLLPYLPEDVDLFGPIHRGAALAHLGVAPPAGLPSQQLNGVFSTVSELLTEFIEHLGAPLQPSPQIPLSQSG